MVSTRDETAVLRRLIELALGAENPDAWQQLQRTGQINAVGATFFLLAPPTMGGVETFMRFKLSRLLQHLTHRTDLRMVEYQGQVRGKIAWAQTHKARYANNYDPTRMVCREVRFRFDTPENQLIKFVVERIQECIKRVPNLLRSGICYSSNPPYTCATSLHLANIEAALKQFRRNVYMQHVSSLEKLSELNLQRARIADLDEYRDALNLFEWYQRFVTDPSLEVIMKCGKQVLPLPGYVEPLADLWLQLGVEILRR